MKHVRRKEGEIEDFKLAAEKWTRRVTQTKKTAFKALIKLGYLNEDGTVSDKYK